MEHRWGTRRTLDVGVKLYVQQGQPRFGRILNASSSGAYVATGEPLPIMTRVHIALGWDGARHGGRQGIAAYVVRADRRGIGIEWHKFAPPAVLALIDDLEMALRPQSRQASAGGKPPLPTHYSARMTAARQSAGFEARG
jgi:hypothetical protein